MSSEITPRVCPVNVCCVFGPSSDNVHCLQVSSTEPVSREAPSGAQASAHTPSECASVLCRVVARMLVPSLVAAVGRGR